MPEDIYKKRLKDVHTSCVKEQLSNMAKNKVLNATPPKISDSEKVLPRATRSTLAQLRSGYSNYLNSYKARLSQNQAVPVTDLCPLCNEESHTTKHLFSCPSNPTALTVRDLWSKPLEVARFLNLVKTDDDPGWEGRATQTNLFYQNYLSFRFILFIGLGNFRRFYLLHIFRGP